MENPQDQQIPYLVDSWEEAEAFIESTRELVGEPSEHNLPLLFRGQADASWKLASTLDRNLTARKSVGEYHRTISTRIRPAFAAYTGEKWEKITDYKLHHQSFSDPDLIPLRRYPNDATYECMIYLRHHGFPSPLLDWSRSAYVAAFFAFREPSNAEMRSIWMYHEAEHPRANSMDEANITRTGQYVYAHKRHIQQQADYTIVPSTTTLTDNTCMWNTKKRSTLTVRAAWTF